jgi:hypothetical protein
VIKLKKKNLLILIVLILIVVIAAFFMFKGKSSKSGGSSQGGGVFSSIKDAMTKSLSLKCEYKVGENTTIAYIKGTSVRIEGNWDGKNSSAAIIKDNKLWTWDTAKKEGIIFPMDTTKAEDINTASKGIIDGLEAQKQFCKVSIFSDTMFDPPVDIKFQDLGDFQNLNIPTPGN